MGRGRLLIVSSVPRPVLIPRRAIAVVRAFRFRSIRVACFSPLALGPTHGGEGPIRCPPPVAGSDMEVAPGPLLIRKQ